MNDNSSKTSYLQSLDPRIKTSTAFLSAVLWSLCGTWPNCCFAFLFSLLLFCLSKAPRQDIKGRLMMLNLFMLLLLVSMVFAGDKEGFGLFLWLKILLKSNAIIIMIFSFFYGMDFAELGYGLAFFRVPEKFIQLFLFTARFNQLMKIECASLLESLKERGFRPGVNIHSCRTIGNLTGVMLMKSYQRSEIVVDAMKCRGFTGRFYSVRAFALSRKDFIFLMLSILFAVIMLGGELF